MKVFGRRDLNDPASGTDAGKAPAVAVPAAVGAPAVAAVVTSDLAWQKTSLLRQRVLKQIDPTVAAELSSAALQRQLEQLIDQIADEERLELSKREQERLAEELTNDMTGYGPLEPLLRDDAVTDIMVNSPNRVFVERRGKLELTEVRFRDAEHIATIARRIASQIGRRIDEASPMVDARLRDGSRVNAVFPPLAVDSPCLSIRKFARKRLDFAGLTANGSISRGFAELLGIAARCRLNILVSGGTGSGKTTLLNAMSQLIDPTERIITIEDAAELQLQQPHVLRLETRPASLEGTGQISQRDLVRNALRMRPDRIIVGEVRGDEAFDMLQAMNTGHDGSISTVHANSARDALARVENMVLMGQFGLPARAIRTQIASAIHLIVQVERMRDGVRRVVQLAEICGMEGEVVTMNDVVRFEFEREDKHGQIHGRYNASGLRPTFTDRLRFYGLNDAWMTALGNV